MSSSRPRFKFNPLKNPSDAFMDFLEGYASAFDFYSVCSRPIGSRDVHSLVDEFWRVTQDFSSEAAAIAASEAAPSSEQNTDGNQLRLERRRSTAG